MCSTEQTNSKAKKIKLNQKFLNFKKSDEKHKTEEICMSPLAPAVHPLKESLKMALQQTLLNLVDLRN